MIKELCFITALVTGGPAFAAGLTISSAPPPPAATVINPSNPVSASSITDAAGTTWSFGAAINAAFGSYHVLPHDTPTGTWQLVKAQDGTVYAMDMAGDQWYHWSGSAWVSTGTAPPVTGNGMPALLEVFPNSLTDTTTLPTWLGRVPNSIGGLPSGPAAYFGFDGFYPPNGKDAWPFNITYRTDVCTNAAGNVFCPSGYSADFVGIANGAYDALMTNQLQTYVLPQAKNIYYIRVQSEWGGNFWDFSPFYGTVETNPPCSYTGTTGGDGIGYMKYGGSCVVPPDIWKAAVQHVITVLRNVVINGPGGNPNIKIQIDAPADAIQEAYYPGDAYPDVVGTDLYISSTTPTNARSQFMFYMNATGGWTSNAYELTFAQKHNKPFVYPEWCDASAAPNEVDSTIITLFANLFASVNGPGKAAIAAHGYWDEPPGNGGFQCDFTHDPAKQAAYAQAWPNGFANTYYHGTTWPQVLPMPTPNPWQP